MENKEVEDALFCLSVKARREPYTDPMLIANYLSGITSYIEFLEQHFKAKDKALTKEEQYKLALFMVLRNSKVMPKGLELGKTMKEINQMSKDACREIMASINFDKARKEYDNGID